MRAAFVFLHVGSDLSLPRLLVRSIRALQPGAELLQCSDLHSPSVDGVDQVFRCAGDTANLMTFRLEAFVALGRETPAIYLDTDMLCVRALDPIGELGDCDVAVCGREFAVNKLFNPKFRELDLSEYDGKTLGEVYPFVACATICASSAFWMDCRDNLATLHPKFRTWYGDQEAIRNVIAGGKYRHKRLPESLFGCLPDKPVPASLRPFLLHFKGEARKPLMLEMARQLKVA